MTTAIVETIVENMGENISSAYRSLRGFGGEWNPQRPSVRRMYLDNFETLNGVNPGELNDVEYENVIEVLDNELDKFYSSL